MARSRLVLLILVLVLLAAAVLFLARRQHRGATGEGEFKVNELLGGAAPQGFLRAVRPRAFHFPEDHGPHPGYRTEWWYFTGNLATAQGRRFGYQLTFFRFALHPEPVPRQSHWGANEVFMAHFAVTDVAEGKFHAAERFSRGAAGLAGAKGVPLLVNLEEWSARAVRPEPWTVQLKGEDAGVAIDLTARAVTGIVPNGEGGLSRKGREPGNASYYYSVPRLATEGVIRIGGENFTVSGLSWLDREWSTSALEAGVAGWDWFALQLGDGRDLMLYRLRRTDGSVDPFSSGTLVAADGGIFHLRSEDVMVKTEGRWQSPAGGDYPARWRVTVPGHDLDLEVAPLVHDQEHRGSIPYWEGAVSVKGVTAGRTDGFGYVELTGYGESSRPAGR